MNKLVGIYLFIITLIACIIIFVPDSFGYLIHNIPYPVSSHRLTEGLVSVILFLIFFRANNIYSKTNDKRMAIIAGGFLVAGFLNLFHLAVANHYPYDVLTVQNFQKNPFVFFLWIEKLIISFSLFIAIFYTGSPNKTSINFRRLTYIIYFGIVFISILLYQIIFNLLVGKIIYRLMLAGETLPLIISALYLITAFIYADMRLSINKKIFSTFIIGLFILEISELHYINPDYLYGLVSHILKLVGFMLLLIGIKDIQISNVLYLRQKLLAYQTLFLIFAFLTLVSLTSAVFDIKFPFYSSDIFIEFLLISIIIQYLLTKKFTEPITNMINAMKNYKLGEKTEKFSATTNDELCLLAKKFNEIADKNWEYTQELLSREKERIVKNLMNELKFSQNLEQAYNHLIERLAEIFNADRVAYAELPLYDTRKVAPKYEYLKDPDEPSFIGVAYPKASSEDFFELQKNMDNSQMLIVNDIKNHHKNDKEAQDFYDKYHLKSMIKCLLVRHNKSAKVLGVIVLYSHTLRIWTEYEIDLLKSISDSVVNVIWEISKILETEELRNTFILTLAHDFQVPLVGERNALEYIISRNPEEPMGKFRDIIQEIIANNRCITSMLHHLLDIYNYESGKKTLNISKSNIAELISEEVSNQKDTAQSKSVSIVVDIEKDLPDAYFDKNEIENVLGCLLQNAIFHTREGTRVIITSHKEDDTIKTCIIDQGMEFLQNLKT